MTDREDWLIVEAKRDDGTPTMFRIRELAPQRQLTKIFVVELPYPKTELSRLPGASDYRRLSEFEEQWLRPACTTLGWQLVGSKAEDGSFFLYMYGAGDPGNMIEKLSPFDVALGFYDDDDPDWQEYGTLRDLLDQAKAIPPASSRQNTVLRKRPAATQTNRAVKAKPKAKAKATKATKATKAKPNSRAKAKAKPSKRKRR